MNHSMIETNWSEIKGAIKLKWSKLTDNDLADLKGDFGKLAGKVQRAYGIAKEHADRQFEDFKLSVTVLIGQEAPTPAPGRKLTINVAPPSSGADSKTTPAKSPELSVLKNIKLV